MSSSTSTSTIQGTFIYKAPDFTTLSQINHYVLDGKDGQLQYEIRSIYLPEQKITLPILDLTHTYVPKEARGKGLAEKLCIAAIKWGKGPGKCLAILPTCTYIASTFYTRYIQAESTKMIVDGITLNIDKKNGIWHYD